MAQPTAYNKAHDFTTYALQNTTTPINAAWIDSELVSIEVTLDDICENLQVIQRDDGKLANQSVHKDAFDSIALALIGGGAFTIRGAWATLTAYAINDVVEQSGISYVCGVAHTSGTFATDHAAGKWVVLSNTAASNINFTPAGSIAATTVQAALEELDTEKIKSGDTVSALTITTATINGGTINSTNIGATTPGTGKFTTLTVNTSITMADTANIVLDTTTGTKIGTATTQKLGLFNVTPVVQPAAADQASVTPTNTNGAIAALTISAAYSQSEVQALRAACETLADDMRNIATLANALRLAGVNLGVWKGGA